MTRHCGNCGQPITEQRDWHGLRITRGPAALYHRGLRQPHLPPAQHGMLWLLILRRGGLVGHFALQLLTGPQVEDAANVVRVQVLHLRRYLARQRLPFAIVTEHGEGYRLVTLAQ